MRRGWPPALSGLLGMMVFSATLIHFSLTDPPPSIMLSSDSLSWSLQMVVSSSGMWTSCEDPGRDWIDTLAPPTIPVLPLWAWWLWLAIGTQLAASFLYWAGMWAPAQSSVSWPGAGDRWVPAQSSASRKMAEGSEEQRSSTFLWGDKEEAGRIPSITNRERFLLSFLFFHWLRSCLDLVESIEVWMEAWRRGMRRSSCEEPPWDLEEETKKLNEQHEKVFNYYPTAKWFKGINIFFLLLNSWTVITKLFSVCTVLGVSQ